MNLFADDTSLFTFANDPKAAAGDMNLDLNLIQRGHSSYAYNYRPINGGRLLALILEIKL